MKVMVLFCLLAVAFGQCTTVTPQTDNTSTDSLIIRSGTSFGMCVGYCVKDYVFAVTSITLTEASNHTQAQPQYPAKTCQSSISQADWATLKSLATFDAFSKQPDRIDCPDCADAGAEYIELQVGAQKHRVTFDASKTIPGFDALVTALRKQRSAFKDCM